MKVSPTARSDWAFAFPPDDPMQPYFAVNGHAVNETGATIVGSSEVTIAVGETVILLHPPPPLAGVSIEMERRCQQ